MKAKQHELSTVEGRILENIKNALPDHEKSTHILL